MAAPLCDACEGAGIVTVFGRTSAPVASPPEVEAECGECEGSGKDWERTCENCGDEPSATVADDTRYCVDCAKELQDEMSKIKLTNDGHLKLSFRGTGVEGEARATLVDGHTITRHEAYGRGIGGFRYDFTCSCGHTASTGFSGKNNRPAAAHLMNTLGVIALSALYVREGQDVLATSPDGMTVLVRKGGN